MPDTNIVKSKLCKWTEKDVMNIETIKRHHGFDGDMVAIRYALHLTAMIGFQTMVKKKLKESQEGG